MRTKLFFSVKLLLVSILVFSQIGIGTDNPQHPLDVVGAIRTSERLIIENNGPNILFRKSNAVDSEKIWRIGTNPNPIDTRLLFQAYDNGNGGSSYFAMSRDGRLINTLDSYSEAKKWFTVNNTDRSLSILNFNENGTTFPVFNVTNSKVGILKDNPQYPLDVVGAIKTDDRVIIKNDHPNILFVKTNADSDESVWRFGTPGFQGDSRLILNAFHNGTSTGNYFAFSREGNAVSSFAGYNNSQAWIEFNNLSKTFSVAEGANIDLGSVITVSDGKVGINQTAPAAELHVNGAIIIGNNSETPAQADSQCLHPGEMAFSNGIFYGCGPNDGVGNYSGTYEWIPLNNE